MPLFLSRKRVRALFNVSCARCPVDSLVGIVGFANFD
jgi:hypothetical protein